MAIPQESHGLLSMWRPLCSRCSVLESPHSCMTSEFVLSHLILDRDLASIPVQRAELDPDS